MNLNTISNYTKSILAQKKNWQYQFGTDILLMIEIFRALAFYICCDWNLYGTCVPDLFQNNSQFSNFHFYFGSSVLWKIQRNPVLPQTSPKIVYRARSCRYFESAFFGLNEFASKWVQVFKPITPLSLFYYYLHSH